MTRSRPPTDELETEIYDSGRPTVQLATKIGRQPRPPKLPAVEVAEATEISKHPPPMEARSQEPKARTREIEQGTPTEITPPAEPLRVISMKTPAELEAEKRSKLVPKAQIRSIAEVSGKYQQSDMGFLALPRDAKQARGRRVVSNLYWAAIVVAIALVVALALWFITQR